MAEKKIKRMAVRLESEKQVDAFCQILEDVARAKREGRHVNEIVAERKAKEAAGGCK